MSQSIVELLVAIDTVIFLLQHLGFVIISHGNGTNNRMFKSCDKFDLNDSFSNRRESAKNVYRIAKQYLQ